MQTFFDKSEALSLAIQEEIAKAPDGMMAFSRFMALCLYHPKWGYYQTEAFDLGGHTDFITAPEISPLFAASFARQFIMLFEALGEAKILELGAGSGRFAGDLVTELARFSALPTHYYIYEISPALRKKQKAHIAAMHPDIYSRFIWLEELPADFSGIFF